jgi:ATP-dependent Clp protease protease subunit
MKALTLGLKLFEKASTDPVEIYIGTPGGSVYNMFGLYDMIRSCPCHVKTIGVGQVMSAGPLILTAGDERLAYRNAWFMIHEDTWDLEGKLSDHRTEMKHGEQLLMRWADLMEQRTKTPAKKWKKLAGPPDFYFDAPEAVELGIIDKILSV